MPGSTGLSWRHDSLMLKGKSNCFDFLHKRWINRSTRQYTSPIKKGISMSDNQDILKERGKQWGDPRATHKAIAKLWSVIVGVEITSFQVALMMSLLKIWRIFINPKDEDSYKDSKGYIDIASFIAEPSEEIAARYRELTSYLGTEGEEE